jgi:hypothetical protein
VSDEELDFSETQIRNDLISRDNLLSSPSESGFHDRIEKVCKLAAIKQR